MGRTTAHGADRELLDPLPVRSMLDYGPVATASLLGIDAGSWSVIIAGRVLAISVYSVISARRAEACTDRVADATVASARPAERSAGAAEQGAQSGFSITDGSSGTGLQGAVWPVVRIPTKSDELGWAEELAIKLFWKAAKQMDDGAMWESRGK